VSGWLCGTRTAGCLPSIKWNVGRRTRNAESGFKLIKGAGEVVKGEVFGSQKGRLKSTEKKREIQEA